MNLAHDHDAVCNSFILISLFLIIGVLAEFNSKIVTKVSSTVSIYLVVPFSLL